MALQINIKTESGIVINNAYARVEDVSSSGKDLLSIRVRFYASQSHLEKGYNWIEDKMYQLPLNVNDDAPNYHKQGYEYLKDLPEFTNAIDC